MWKRVKRCCLNIKIFKKSYCKKLFVLLTFILAIVLLVHIIIYATSSNCKEETFSNEKLPKIIHVSWKNSTVPSLFSSIRASQLHYYPADDFTHYFWTDELQDEFMQEEYPEYYAMYDDYPFDIQRADALRYFVLYHYGGLYADMDYEFLENFWNKLPDDRPAIVESPYKYAENVQNSLMSSPPKHPLWLKMFDLLEQQRDERVYRSTGPNLFDSVDMSEYYLLDCRMYQRIPHEMSETYWMNHLHRETLGRLYPMKDCLNFGDNSCPEYARHHALGSYVKDTGLKSLLWNI